MTEQGGLNALTLFKEEMASEELCVRVNTIRRLPLVIHLISSSVQQKETLLSFLDTLIDTSDDDEVLFGLAETLLSLSNYIQIAKLLGLYEKLLGSEETIVREKTADSFIQMSKKLERNDIASTIVPFVVKLTGNQTFGTKMSALTIMTEIFPILNQDEKKIVLEKIGALFAEESLILRRNLAGKLGKICHHVNKDTLTLEIFNHFKNLTNDDSDSVRIITIESLIELAKVFNDDDNKTYVIPLIIQMTGDKSWRVKHHLAKWFAELAKAVGKDIADNSLISIFSTLLRDPENEVRIASIRSLKNFVSCLSLDKIHQIFAYLQSLSKDSVSHVKTGVCEVLQVILKMDIEVMGKDVIKTKILPIVSDLCSDKDIEVKIETLRIFPLWTKWTGSFVIEQIANGTLALATESPQWRIRNAILESHIAMCIELKSLKIFEKYVRKMILAGIHDKIFQVRKMIIKSLKNLACFLDDATTIDLFLKEYTKIATDPSYFYVHRISALYGLEAVMGILQNKDKMKDQYYKILLKTAEEINVNIRYVAIKILINAGKQKPFSDLMDSAKKVLTKLKEVEKDGEIKFVVEEFLK